MRLKRVEIYGFKSFAQRTELSFDKGITGIVGPNGSGKSNIADAVRWVLGEQSAKTLRGTKMEDVIFNGTQTRKALPYCEVSLQFDNEDGALNTPFAEVMVTRRAYRNGEGEYYLNKNSCRLRDVLELFRDTGIGKEGYSIIGQGRIEEILSSRGDERRGVFEEAAGIVTFRVRKEEAERKLARTRDNLLRVGDLLEELQSRLAPLEEQAKAAQEYLALSERLRHLELNVFLVRHDRLRDRLASLAELGQGLQGLVASHESELKQLARQRQELDEALEQANMRDAEARQAESQAQSEHFRLQSLLQQEENKLQMLAANTDALVQQAQEDSEKLAELEALLAQGLDDSQAQDAQEQQAKARSKAQRQQLEKAQQAAEEAEQALDAHRQDILAAMTRLSDVKSAQARQQAMLNQMEQRQQELLQEKDGLSDSLAQQQSSLDEAMKLHDQVTSDIQRMELDLAALAEALSAAQAREEDQATKLRQLGSQAESTNSRLKLLQEMSREYEGYGLAVKRALQHAQGDSRVHGVVAQLIQVPQAYETAIEMILGGALQHIVTQDEESAKALIDYLRSNRLGRTTFLPISAIRPRLLSSVEMDLLGQPGCIGLASELVSCAPQHRAIVENLLGRTVIVEDLDVAIQLSRRGRQAFTVVTLLGDVMRAGGAMTGGTTQARAASLLGREREILQLGDQLKEERAALAALQLSLEGAMQQQASAKRLHDEAVEALNQERIALARESERVDNARHAHQQSLERQEALQHALLQLEEAMGEIRADLQGASRQTQVAAHDQQQMEAETLRLQQLLSQARQAAQQEMETLTRLQEEQTRLAHERDIQSRDHARLRREVEALKGALCKSAAAKANMDGDRQRLVEALEQRRDELALVATEAQNRQSAVKSLEQERAALQAKQRGCLDAADLLHSRHQQDSDKLHKNELVQSRTQSELQAISDYVFSTYELTYGGAEAYRSADRFEMPKAELEVKGIKQRIRDMGSVNVNAIEDFALTSGRYKELDTQREDALRAQDDLEQLISQLLNQMAQQFVQEFAKLNDFFSQTFRRLFGGGQAELVLTDPSQPLTCDIEVAAQPPGKKLQMLSLLSGGERALTAIAILFAMLKLKPTPFCILDEIEAALDEANIGHFADYLSEYAQSTQFIVITHRKGTMERCDALYGVAMEEKGISSMVSVDLLQYA